MRVAGFRPCSLFDGPGINFVIFTQGCGHKCKGCHNPSTWDRSGGKEMSVTQIKKKIIPYLGFIDGICFSGGEPLLQKEEVDELAEWSHEVGLKTTLYTGFTLEEIKGLWELTHIDYIIDGPYVAEKHLPDIPFRGSANQKIYHHETNGNWENIESRLKHG